MIKFLLTGLHVSPPQKVLPIDGDYPGGQSGIPQDGYWPIETGHGATPYYPSGGAEMSYATSIVYDPNCIEFPVSGMDPVGANKSRSSVLQHQFY